MNKKEEYWYKKGREDLSKELLVKIDGIMESVRSATGSFKYDSCYEDVKEIILKDNN